MKVFIIEWQQLEAGGAEQVAFDARDKAEAWLATQDNDHYREIFEVEVQ